MKLFSLAADLTITDIQWQVYPIGFLLLLLWLLTIFGNLLIIYVIIRENTLHTSTYYYIVSLAFSDFLVGLIVMPFAFIFGMTYDEYWLFPRHLKFLCDFWHSMNIFACTASIFSVCTIGLDRYMVITKPIEYRNVFLSKKWFYVLLNIWISSAIIAFPAVTLFGTVQETSQQSLNQTLSTSIISLKECQFPDNPSYVLFMSIFSFYLPLTIMIYVYIKVYVAAREQVIALHSGYKRHNRNKCAKSQRLSLDFVIVRIHHGKYRDPTMKNENIHSNISRKTFSKDQKAATTIGLIMGTFVFCWLPCFGYLLLSGVFSIRLKNERNHELLLKIFSWLGYTNSALDVLIYVFTSKELQMTFSKLFVSRRS
ncbi:hypothetical protein I4U23_016170 [Adineta vaga]|nr:hypothetical protein I4U23_016170 [Adineta vaga]